MEVATLGPVVRVRAVTIPPLSILALVLGITALSIDLFVVAGAVLGFGAPFAVMAALAIVADIPFGALALVLGVVAALMARRACGPAAVAIVGLGTGAVAAAGSVSMLVWLLAA
jgi:hypothetical protein